jgi:pyridoxamine 5'-phosphate oxidase
VINFINNNKTEPFILFKNKYDFALESGQNSIEAAAIASFSKSSNEANSRFVNIKICDGKDFIFFSNYNSVKSQDFKEHNQITALFFWDSINTQIRIKALINRTTKKFNDEYFLTRSNYKNALAISSDQSKPIDSFDSVKKKYCKVLELENLDKCPSHWGGFSFNPYYFEFWEGHDYRVNKRQVYELVNNNWKSYILEP